MMPSGRLRAATIILARGPSWWDLHGARVVGLGVGGALALLIIGTFPSTFLPPAPLPTRAPACTHCGALLGASVTRCTHCGAAQRGQA